MHTLHISLLGDFRLVYGIEPLTSVNTPRLQALLVYLLLHRQAPQTRQHIAFQFWPDSSEKQAHTNLRKLLFQLRHALPDPDRFLVQDHLAVQWRLDAPYTLDVADLQAALARCLTGDGKPLAQAQSADLAQVVNLYQGELLPGCFEEWLLPLRQQLQQDVMAALEQLIQAAEHQREYQAGIRYAQRLLGFDPLHEIGYRRLMQFHALNGDRAAALHEYHTCAARLQQELGVEPAEETQALYQRILKLDGQPALLAAASFDAPFVGREEEWQTLLATWRQVQRGQAHFVGLVGEAGMGKTRLTEEWIAWANAQGIHSARSRSYEAEGGLAYAPVTEWLRSSGLRPALKKLDKLWLSEVARLLPELLTEQPNLPPPGPLTEAWQRQRFFEALARAILVEKVPLLLVIDDLQWCDSETLTWLRYLLRYEPKARLLILGAWRSEVVTEAHPLQVLLRDLQNANQVTTIELTLFSAAETAALARHLVAQPFGANSQEQLYQAQLYQATEGHPLFVIETLRSGWRSKPADQRDVPAPAELPPKIQAVMQTRLSQLSAQARQLTRVAAVIGRQFTYQLLAQASKLDDDTLVACLDELWRQRIIREQTLNHYDFSHDRMRETAYSEISPMLRRHLHKQVAQTMEALYATVVDTLAGQLAAHYEQAALPALALRYYRTAGERALATYATQQALHAYHRLLALAEQTDDLITAHRGLGALYSTQDDPEAAIRHLQAGLALTTPTDPQRAKLLYLLADVHFARYDVATAERYVQQALHTAELTGDEATLCQSLSLLGQIESSRGNVEAELTAISQALIFCRRAGNRWREGRTLADLGWLNAQRAEFDQAILHAKQALACLEPTDDQAGIAFVWNILGRAYGGCGQYRAAFAAFERSRQVAEAIHHTFFMAQVPNMLGWLHQQLGDYAGALAHDQAGVELARRWQKAPAEISALINVQIDQLHLGDPQQALAGVEALRARIDREAIGFHAWRWQLRLEWVQGLCLLALGQPQALAPVVARGLALATKTTSYKYVALFHELQGNALAALNDLSAATAALETAVALADKMAYLPLRWQGRYRLALLHRQGGQMAVAARYHAESVAIIQTIADTLDDQSLRTTFLQTAAVRAAISSL